MSPLRRTLHLLVALALFACPVLAAGEEEGLDRGALERQILTGLAKGQDVAPQIELWLGDENAARRAQRPQSQVGRELRDALAALRSALPRTEAGLPGALAAYDALRGADLLMRNHFRSVAGFAAVRDQIAAALETGSPPILRASVLPYRLASLATRPPRTEPVVVPSYRPPSRQRHRPGEPADRAPARQPGRDALAGPLFRNPLGGGLRLGRRRRHVDDAGPPPAAGPERPPRLASVRWRSRAAEEREKLASSAESVGNFKHLWPGLC